MMNGGLGMFSRPVSVMRNRCSTSQRASRRMKRYRRGGCVGSGWTSGSSGAATSARNSGPVYSRAGREGSAGSSGEEVVEDAVELLGPFGLRCVPGAFDHGKPAVGDDRVRPGRVLQRKQRIVGAPDELHGNPQLSKARGHVVLAAQQRPGMDERPDGRQVRVVEVVRLVKLAQV